ncbi:MAG TPA: TetR/AcrR family transcriptional regulator [Candidatus Limnocylindrales bacterium]|nr:TetR/AcrR family transcriptional regulator [Candidatus Limnocylindrales bacterium]
MTGIKENDRAVRANATEKATRRASRPGRKPVTWKKDPHGRRERVLVEATRLFSERGYAAVSTGDIARAAGVAEGNVFHYFGSKPELLKAVGERYGAGFATAMFGVIEPVASRKTVEQMVRRAFDFVSESWPGFGLFLLSDDPSAAPLAQKANRVAITQAVERMLEVWSSRHILDDVDAPVVAEILFGLMEASLRACFTGLDADGDRPSRQRFEAQTVLAISRILGIPETT